MKKTGKKVFALALALSLAFSAVVVPTTDAAPKAKKITLNAKTKKVSVGTKFTLKVKKVKPAKASKKVTWKSSKKKVAKVSKKGVVTAVKKGKAVITATSKSNKKAKAKCVVTVTNKVAPIPSPSVQPTQSVAPTATPTPTEKATAEPTKTPRPTATPYKLPEESLKENADFTVGTVINYDRISNKSFTELAKQQFDLISFENEMKGYSLINVGASSSKVTETGDEKVVECQFDRADEMVQWCIDNGLKIRGHVLFAESTMAEAFFYKGYNTDEATREFCDAETLKARMESYASQVVTHFETKFPDTVLAWDVLNEAINADATEKDATTGLYLNQGNFYQILGGDYVKIAFQCAKKAVAETGKSIDLFYNDFNCFQSPKTTRISDLIKYVNKDEKLIDCMGMQGYVLVGWPNANDVKNTMTTFSKLGVKVGITELTVRLSPQYKISEGDKVTEADITAHAARYAEMFKVYKDFDKANPGVLTNVSIWGLTDRPDLEAEADKPEEDRHYDYGVYGTHSGLFTMELREKDAFNQVIAELKK